jgi:hypothetical protein
MVLGSVVAKSRALLLGAQAPHGLGLQLQNYGLRRSARKAQRNQPTAPPRAATRVPAARAQVEPRHDALNFLASHSPFQPPETLAPTASAASASATAPVGSSPSSPVGL